MAQTPPLIERIGVAFPVYVRKLSKKSDWGHTTDQSDNRIFGAASSVFPKADTRFSFYFVENLEDLSRVVVGLNSVRNRLNDQVDLIAIQASEFRSAEIDILEDAPGNTECCAANSLHVDVIAKDNEAFVKLCRLCIEAGRPAFRVTKSEAKRFVSELDAYGCNALVSGVCPCQSNAQDLVGI